MLNHTSSLLAAVAAMFFVLPVASGADPSWKAEEAAKYLDGRQKTWFEFSAADRGEGAGKTSCVSCHTLLPYVIARPVLRNRAGAAEPTEHEKKLLAQTALRIENWSDLDSAKYRLMYDSNERKKKESRGTEAVLNAVIVAFDDRYRKKTAPGDLTRRAFVNLWQTQIPDGDLKGSWDWLNFSLEPWESKGARYYGACLAAIAIGTAPGYYTAGADRDTDAKIALLRGYLKRS